MSTKPNRVSLSISNVVSVNRWGRFLTKLYSHLAEDRRKRCLLKMAMGFIKNDWLSNQTKMISLIKYRLYMPFSSDFAFPCGSQGVNESLEFKALHLH